MGLFIKTIYLSVWKQELKILIDKMNQSEATLKAHIHPKYIAPRTRQIWISCDTKLSKNRICYHRLVSLQSDTAHIF